MYGQRVNVRKKVGQVSREDSAVRLRAAFSLHRGSERMHKDVCGGPTEFCLLAWVEKARVNEQVLLVRARARAYACACLTQQSALSSLSPPPPHTPAYLSQALGIVNSHLSGCVSVQMPSHVLNLDLKVRLCA